MEENQEFGRRGLVFGIGAFFLLAFVSMDAKSWKDSVYHEGTLGPSIDCQPGTLNCPSQKD